MINEYDCFKCHKHITYNTEGQVGAGYGLDENDNPICYNCCAIVDRDTMDEEGWFVLYLVKRDKDYYVSNWPGTLEYKVDSYSYGRHNIAGTRVDVWFTDYKGKKWWGARYGNNTQLCRCKRLKDK